MKKILLVLSITFTLLLSGCIPTTDTQTTTTTVDTLTEEEITSLVQSLIPDATVDTSYDLLSFQDSIIGMIEQVKTGVLGIQVNSETGSGSGTGVVYKREGDLYYLVTNAHVVAQSEEAVIKVIYEKNSMLFEILDSVELIGYDFTTDLAVLTFSSTQEFSVIPMADSYDLELGQFVYAIGNPLGFDYYGTVTMGIISGLARYVDNAETGGQFSATLLQHDAALSPGNSGGALVNVNGELIGINNMKLVDDNVSNIGFAIPSNTVKRIVADLEDDGDISRPYFGILANVKVNVCGIDYGVCILDVTGGAAEVAGIQPGDVIIGFMNTSMEDFKEINNFDELREAILNSSVGETVVIKYIRDGEELISNEATLGVHPED